MFRLLLFCFFLFFQANLLMFVMRSNINHLYYTKNAIADRILNKYLSYSRNHVELDSKFGRRVQKKVKIRKRCIFSSTRIKTFR